jgi:hypothetical protein
VANPCGYGVETFDFSKGSEFLEEVSKYCLQKNESALWNCCVFLDGWTDVWLVDWLVGWPVS